MRYKQKLNGIEGVAPGGTATVNVPLERRYHGGKIFATSTVGGVTQTASQTISKVRFLVNGILQRDVTPAQLLAIAKLNKKGYTPDASELPFFFSEPWRASVIGEEATSWDVFGQTKFTIEIVLANGITAPAVSVHMSYDFGRNLDGDKPFLAIVKQLVQTYTPGAGQFDITTLPVSRPIQRLLLSSPTANAITSCEVYRAGTKIQEGSQLENARFLADHDLDASQFSYPIVFDYEQQVSSAIKIDREGDLLIRPTISVAETVTVLIESRATSFA